MYTKEPNIRFANEVSGTFKVGIPEILSDSIRIPAFDFAVFDADYEYENYHENALLVFEGVLGSTRKVKLFANQHKVEKLGGHEIVDGPFRQPNPDRQLYHISISVYSNPPDAWIDWDIIAESVHVDQIDKQTLIHFSHLRGVNFTIAKSALEDVDKSAIGILLDELKTAQDYRLILPLYCKELTQAAKGKATLLEIADVLIQNPSRALLKLADELSAYHTESAAALIRDIIAAGFDASASVIKAIYGSDNDITRALSDSSEPVRILAAETLEKQDEISGLILCLDNDSARVREIAGWSIGRKKVSEARDALVNEITTGKFTVAQNQAQIEALRAAIWALGVLRTNNVRPYLELLTKHENQLICDTAVEALSKLPYP